MQVRLADADVDFKPVKSWLGRPKTETVDGWQTEARAAGPGRLGPVPPYRTDSCLAGCTSSSACIGPCPSPSHLRQTQLCRRHIRLSSLPPGLQVYEASGSLVAAAYEKAAVGVPPEATFEEYLEMELPADTVQVG